jgi:TrmH family RNA methyltransferase
MYRRADGFVVVAVDVQDPGNLGAVIRAAEAGGATGVLVCGVSAHPFSWKALRGSMGSALRLPIASAPDVEVCVRDLRAAGVRTVAAAPRDGRDPDALDWTGPCALVLGGEGTGLRDAVRGSCDDNVTIPMAAPVESLNVAVAAAILIYAARRQRSSVRLPDDTPSAAFGTTPNTSRDRRT